MKKIFGLFVVVLCLTSCDQNDKISLSLALEEGETYNYNSHIQMDLAQVMMGQEMDLVMQMDAKMSFTSEGIVEDQNQVVSTYDFLSFSTKTPQMEMEINSDKVDPENPMSTIFVDMIGKEFNFKLSHLGRVSEVDGIDQLWANLVNNNDDLSQQEKSQLEVQLKETYGAESFGGSLETSFAIYPENKVKKGDSWTVETMLQNSYPATVKTTYTLKDFDADYAYLEGEGKIMTSEKDNTMQTGGMSFEFDLEGSNTSTLKVNRKTGWIEEAKLEQNAKGDMKFAEAPAEMEDQSIQLDISYLIEIDNQ